MAFFGLNPQETANGDEYAMMHPYIPTPTAEHWFSIDIPFDAKVKLVAAAITFLMPLLIKSPTDQQRDLRDLFPGTYPLKYVVWRWGLSVRFLAVGILFWAAANPLAERPAIALLGTIICIYSYIWMGVCWKTANEYEKQQIALGKQKRWVVMLTRGYIMWVAVSSLGLLNLWFVNG